MPPPCPVGDDVSRAAEILRAGGLVAFATETVYGLGANALDAAAVARVFEAKERPHFDPLIVHVPDTAWLPRIVARVPDAARPLMERFWPGPLTLVMPKTEAVPDLVTSGLPTVAVRMPAHPMALDLIRQAGTPIAAPSANRFGRISPTTAAHVVEQLGERIDYVLDGGACAVGVESTVLHVADAPPALLRPGGLPVEEIEAVIGPVRVVSHTSDEAPALAPGMLTRHYAPRTPLTITADPVPTAAAASEHASERIGLLTLRPLPHADRFAAIEILSPTGNLREAAAAFFAALRRLDAASLDRIVAIPFPDHGLGRALNDRLRRAAH